MPIDRIPFWENEQYASADLTAMQRVLERYLEDVAAYAQRSIGIAQSYSNDGAQPSVALVGGLAAFVSGSGLDIDPGMLMTTSVPSPDNPNLSGAYLCTNAETTTVALPSPVSDTWYAICARPELVDDAPLARRVWDVGGQHWNNTSLVKRQRSTMAFDVVPSSVPGQLSFIPPANAVPIWAVLRPAGGGAVLEAHVVDVRPVRPVGGARGSNDGQCGVDLRHNAWSYTAAGLLQLSAHVVLENIDLHAVTMGLGADPLLFKDPSYGAPADGEWWYLYLARYPALGPLCAPRHAQLGVADLAQQGLVVLSKRAPGTGAYGLWRTNGGDITAPAPFNASVIGAGGAALVGALKRQSGAWQPCQGDGDRVTMLGFQGGTPHAGTHNFNFDHGAPLGARQVTLELDQANAVSNVIEIDRPDGTVSLWYSAAPPVPERRVVIDLPVGPLGNSTTARLRASVDNDWTHRLRGYRI